METYTHKLLLPHEVFGALASSPRGQSLLLGDAGPDGPAQFWQACGHEEFFEAHPFRDAVLQDPASCIPIKLHGDGAKGFCVSSWAPVLLRRFVRFMITVEDEEYRQSAADDLVCAWLNYA